ncbi:hypothetical protein K1719_006790 [Acacia pycnantha]|nr:hypothetical protein K1719_006790 [Acacia pycnantha]
MDDASSKTELLTPLVLKAGVPLAALSLAALIYAGIIAKRSLFTAPLNRPDRVDSPETNDSQQGVKPDENSHGLPSKKDEEVHNSESRESNPSLEQEISGLRSQVEGLQKRESDLRLQFDRYCDMKERESLLMQVMNLLSQETCRVEFLEKEISFMEAENRKLEGFLVQYVRIIEQLDGWKSQNRLLRGRLKKLQRKSNAQSRLTNKQSLKIKASEAEILENRDALHTRIDMINQVKNEIRELHSVLEQLQNQKNELVKKLDEAEKSYASKVEELDASKEEYKKLQKEREAEAEEVVRLRWMNACLRHKLERKDDHTMPCFGGVPSEGVSSKKNKLLSRLKKWGEGSDKARVSPVAMERDDHESHPASDKTPLPA